MEESKEIIDFYKKCVADGNRNFAEIGVWIGLSIKYLVKELIKTGEPFNVYAVDLWDELTNRDTNGEGIQSLSFDLFKKHMDDLIHQVHIIKKDSNIAALSIVDKSLDVVFIDAAHEYDAVYSNINSWLPKIKDKGIIAGHDYGEPCGVKKAVDEIFPSASVVGTVWSKVV